MVQHGRPSASSQTAPGEPADRLLRRSAGPQPQVGGVPAGRRVQQTGLGPAGAHPHRPQLPPPRGDGGPQLTQDGPEGGTRHGPLGQVRVPRLRVRQDLVRRPRRAGRPALRRRPPGPQTHPEDHHDDASRDTACPQPARSTGPVASGSGSAQRSTADPACTDGPTAMSHSVQACSTSRSSPSTSSMPTARSCTCSRVSGTVRELQRGRDAERTEPAAAASDRAR
nr:hypothetical protein [Pseudonocardia sp. ICBG601]